MNNEFTLTCLILMYIILIYTLFYLLHNVYDYKQTSLRLQHTLFDLNHKALKWKQLKFNKNHIFIN